ncbi:uncharacterized protein FA14DRAFT_160494 [Meira miltonrushii]|uniref:DASH complex subunit SPC34 n=1 Tax=Meira miltonrushii TaxID=1280837 RepID=A0A316VID9_9BASI|nr:uncharacterized protein FA14DRAFT_160494 [Meira miltonrushii]PWN35275.1 hypothetical protein FA14DRAFT_160494 [Meira miltonrushii]
MAMETHLTTLSATLDAISRIHNKPSRSSSRPFTSAILNTHKLDVLDFIRDADQFEANLFWYPPRTGDAGGSNVAGPSSRSRDDHAKAAVSAPEINVAPRLPEPKAFNPPTPLRKAAKDAEARGLVEFDARTLLKAAQKLTDNYHSVPRARKHIKTLLKKHADLQRTIRELDNSVAENDALIAKVQTNPGLFTSGGRVSKSGDGNASLDIDKIQEDIRREEMEILAIEQTMEDLQEQKKRMKQAPSRSKTATTPRKSSQATPKKTTVPASTSQTKTPTPRSSIGDRTTPRSSVGSKTKAAATPSPRKSATKDKSPAKELHSTPARDITAQVEPIADLADETIRLQPSKRIESEGEENAKVARQSSIDTTVTDERGSAIETSDELERICENIWAMFGDNLRYAAPSTESANVEETIEILQNLSLSKDSNSSPDISTASSNVTGTTAATSGSTISTSALPNAGPPSPTTVIAARILISMLKSAAPHSEDIEELKKDASSWWSTEGSKAYSQASRGDLDMTSLDSGEALAKKSIYELAAKKIIKFRFKGTKRVAQFAAHI